MGTDAISVVRPIVPSVQMHHIACFVKAEHTGKHVTACVLISVQRLYAISTLATVKVGAKRDIGVLLVTRNVPTTVLAESAVH